MRAAVIGAGSIGRRHVSLLLERADVERVTVVTSWDGAEAALPSDPRLEVVGPGAVPESDVAIVAVETAAHITTALPLVAAGIDTLIEKPLSHSNAGVQELEEAAGVSGAGVFVAYNLRFVPAVRMLGEIVARGDIGRICSARFECGQWLPDWRPGRDYRQTYSAHRERGGGVALDLSHEVDSMRFILGDPDSWCVRKDRVSDLEIDAEDVFEGVYTFERALATVHLDYLARETRRMYRILGTQGEAVCDLARRHMRVATPEGEQVYDDAALFDVAGSYRSQIDAFLTARNGEPSDLATLADGARVLELLEDARA